MKNNLTFAKIIKVLSYILFFLYVLLMLWLMFGQRLLHRLTTPSIDWLENYWYEFFDQINLMPFHTIVEFTMALMDGWDYIAIMNLAGNIVMFIPLGFLLPYITKRALAFKQCMTISLVCILCAELIQIFTLLGSFDIDDLILNMIGVSIGFWLQGILNRLFQASQKSITTNK